MLHTARESFTKCSAEFERKLDELPVGVGMDEFDRLGSALVDNTSAGVAVARVVADDLTIGVAIRDPEFEMEYAVNRAVVDPLQRRSVATGRIHPSGDDDPVVESGRCRIVDWVLSSTDAERGGDAVGCQRHRIVVIQLWRLFGLLLAETARDGHAKTADCSKEQTAVHTSFVEGKPQKPKTGSKRHFTHPHLHCVEDTAGELCKNPRTVLHGCSAQPNLPPFG